MTIDEIQDALKFDMDMMLFDANTGETYPKESLKHGNEMNYIHYCAQEEAIELLEELKVLRKIRNADVKRGINMYKLGELIKGRELTIGIVIFLSTQGIKCVINDGKVLDFVLE